MWSYVIDVKARTNKRLKPDTQRYAGFLIASNNPTGNKASIASAAASPYNQGNNNNYPQWPDASQHKLLYR